MRSALYIFSPFLPFLLFLIITRYFPEFLHNVVFIPLLPMYYLLSLSYFLISLSCFLFLPRFIPILVLPSFLPTYSIFTLFCFLSLLVLSCFLRYLAFLSLILLVFRFVFLSIPPYLTFVLLVSLS